MPTLIFYENPTISLTELYFFLINYNFEIYNINENKYLNHVFYYFFSQITDSIELHNSKQYPLILYNKNSLALTKLKIDLFQMQTKKQNKEILLLN